MIDANIGVYMFIIKCTIEFQHTLGMLHKLLACACDTVQFTQ